MAWSGEEGGETIRAEFDRSIMKDSQGAKFTSDKGFLLPRGVDSTCARLRVISRNALDSGHAANYAPDEKTKRCFLGGGRS
jgi:hypothetical protein